MEPKKKAVVLLSGGLDSTTALSIALWREFKVSCLSIAYGQRHIREIWSAREVAKHYGVPLTEITIDLPWKGSSLLGAEEVPTGRSEKEMTVAIPNTYVPARNLFMLGLAGSFAESIGAEAIFIGVNALDYSGYPDCRPEFIEAMNKAMQLGTKVGVSGAPIVIHTPLISMTKEQIVRWGVNHNAPLELTWSCYKGEAVPCGECDSCILREKGFEAAGFLDPAKGE